MQHKNIILLFQPAHLPTINILYGRWHFVQPVWESRSFYHLINANDRGEHKQNKITRRKLKGPLDIEKKMITQTYNIFEKVTIL